MQDNKKNSFDLRKQHNSDLIRRMRNGEPLNAIDSKTSWYPPRPIIKKDPREMARLYAGIVSAVTKPKSAVKAQDNIKPFVVHGQGNKPLGEAS